MGPGTSTASPVTDPGWTLLVLAAGAGSRYGGIKQLEPFGPHGELLSDYTSRDAERSGATRAIFVINPAHEPAFRAHHARHRGSLAIGYVHQRLDQLPEGLVLPAGRVKPWGTTHAVLCARQAVRGGFVIVNADDYYGPEAIAAAARFLSAGLPARPPALAAIAFPLAETLSPGGPVSRAILRTDAMNDLTGIEERHDVVDPSEDWVSMNCWACPAEMFELLQPLFAEFMHLKGDSLSAECPLPESIGELVRRGLARVRVIRAGHGWLGVTHASDRAAVVERLRALP